MTVYVDAMRADLRIARAFDAAVRFDRPHIRRLPSGRWVCVGPDGRIRSGISPGVAYCYWNAGVVDEAVKSG